MVSSQKRPVSVKALRCRGPVLGATRLQIVHIPFKLSTLQNPQIASKLRGRTMNCMDNFCDCDAFPCPPCDLAKLAMFLQKAAAGTPFDSLRSVANGRGYSAGTAILRQQFFTLDGTRFRSFDAQPNLVTINLRDRDDNVGADDQLFT
jgi:hypothetical protein